ncbi:MAG: amidohydrolase family protein [Phycisphaerae bacterium]
MILRAAFVAPVSAPPIRDGCVKVVGDTIAYVGPIDRLPAAREDVIDLGCVALTPGLVNAHTHLELDCYAGQFPPSPFWPWIERLVALRREPGQEEREARAARDAAWKSLRAGVTCVGDISRRNVAWSELARIPIRKVCFVELLSLADHPPRDPDELRAGVNAVREDALLTVGVTPHAPYTVPEDQIRAAINLAATRRRPWCTHWAETPEEVAFVRGDGTPRLPMVFELIRERGIHSPKCHPVAYLERCVESRPLPTAPPEAARRQRPMRNRAAPWPGLIAHANYVADAELPALAQSGHCVAYCPRAHRFFGHSPHPFERMLAAGVPVVVATDSPASNDGVSLLDELRFLRREVGTKLSDQRLFEMATIGAARALRVADRVGTIEVGKRADLAAFPIDSTDSDPLADVIHSAPQPSWVSVAGRLVVGTAAPVA